ncbi:hypothetical protein O181_045510 [Austropuccinia psidii MF-1]|uniref:Uncharacterized protein n=1 Tax=Austropuccinia psidii MF-1 TaxID=1389203 RepID=A0A9Q3HL98_9BASI|nr:hypothetical protein [Austropuccinia psidii MF-1]
MLGFFPIDHPYAHSHIGFCVSMIYNPYASAMPPHLLHNLPFLFSHTALIVSFPHSYTHAINTFCTKGCAFPQLTILMLKEELDDASFPLEIDIKLLNANLQC